MNYKLYPMKEFLELCFSGAKPNGKYYIVDLTDTVIYDCDYETNSFDDWLEVMSDKKCYVIANMDGEEDER